MRLWFDSQYTDETNHWERQESRLQVPNFRHFQERKDFIVILHIKIDETQIQISHFVTKPNRGVFASFFGIAMTCVQRKTSVLILIGRKPISMIAVVAGSAIPLSSTILSTNSLQLTTASSLGGPFLSNCVLASTDYSLLIPKKVNKCE